MPPDAARPVIYDRAQSSSTMTLQNTLNFTGDCNKGVQVGVNTGTIGDIIFNEKKANDKCLNDLRLTNPRDDKERIRDTKGGLLEGSYKWILDHSDFQRWRNDNQMRLLWVKGDPGKGKTMLLIGIVDELERQLAQLKQEEQSSCPTALSYFFCQGTDSNLNNATAVLRGLIYLLAVQQPWLASNLRKEYERSGSKLFEDGNAFFALSTILSSMLQDPSLARTYIVIDALDECETGLPQLLKLVVENTSASRVKWLVSSRNRHDIELLLKLDDLQTKLSLELKTNAGFVSHAVGVYIDDRVSQLKSLQGDGVLQEQVRHVLRQKAADTFLWVALVIQELKTVASWDVLAVLEEMPTSLEELYARMLKQTQQLKRGNPEFCRLMLSAATLAYRPLYVLELGVLSGLPESISKKAQRVHDLVSMCGSFLTVRDDRVYIIHQSAKDYLSVKAASTIFLSGTAKAHRDISLRSLQAMSNTLRRDIYSLQHPGFSIDDLKTPLLDPLASVRYSCVHWVDHLCEAPQQNDLVDGGPVHKFLEGYLLYWAEALSLLRALSDAILAVGNLERHLKTMYSESSLLSLIQDAYRFLLHNGLVIKNAPLQAYVSALLFSPTRSITRDLFQREEPRWVLTRPTLNKFWGPLVRTLEGHGDWVWSVEFSPDGKLIASGSSDKTIKVWDATTGELKHTLEGHGDWVLSVAFSPNGKLIASGSDDKTIKIWDATTGEVKHTLEGHGDWVLSVAFSPDGKLIASGSLDRTIKVWDAATGELKHTLEGHGDGVLSVAFSPNGKLIASGSDDKTIKVWDTATGKVKHTRKGHRVAVGSVVFSPDGKLIASGSDDRTIKVWDAGKDEVKLTLEGHGDWVLSVAFSPNGKLIASGSDDKTIKIWDATTGEVKHTLEGHGSGVKSIIFSPDGKLIASGSDDKTIKIWDLATDEVKQTLESHPIAVGFVVFSPDGKLIASGSSRQTKVWDAATGKVKFEAHCNWVLSVTFSPDEKLIALGSSGSIEVRDAATGSIKHELLAVHDNWVRSVAFSLDGKLMASGSDDKTIKVWDVATGKVKHTLHGHGNWVRSVAFSPDSKLVVSGSSDKTIKVWDVATGEVKNTLESHRSVHSVSFDTTGLYLLTNIGYVDVDALTDIDANGPIQSQPQARRCGYGLNPDKSWITWNDQKVLLLPSEYRPSNPQSSAIWHSISTSTVARVAIGCDSGRVIVISFTKSPPDLPST